MCWADIWAFPLRFCMQKAAIFVLVHKSLSFVVLPCSKFLGYHLPVCTLLTHGKRSRDTVKECWLILKSSRNKITQKSLIVFTQIIGIHYSAGLTTTSKNFSFLLMKKSQRLIRNAHFFSYYCCISNTSFYPFSSAWKLTRAILQRNADKCARNNII